MPVIQLGVQQAAHSVGAEILGGAGRNGQTVLRRFEHGFGADRARGPRLIDDNDLLTESLFDLLRDDANDLKLFVFSFTAFFVAIYGVVG